MKQLLLSLFILATLTPCHYAAAADSAMIFNLPLGGKLKMPVRVCEFREIGSDQVRSMCWIERPFMHKGTMLGGLELPNPDSRPSWAAHALFKAQVGNDGTLEKLSARSSSFDRQYEIRQSIESRFGLPSEVSPTGSPISGAAWHQKDIHIKMLCSREIGCDVEFSSVRAYDALQKELSARRAKDSARPISP
jgi:hypothetical protein